MADAKTDSETEIGEHPTGWEVLAGSQAVVTIVDTLLDLPPRREFNKSELADLAGVSRKSVHTHIDSLLQIGLVTEVEGTRPTRYRFDTDSEVAKQLIKLDAAVNNAGPHAGE